MFLSEIAITRCREFTDSARPTPSGVAVLFN
nr:MAG TPA: hypothetical protein [Caudoviricetes sp.]